jgi:hypothetical protein
MKLVVELFLLLIQRKQIFENHKDRKLGKI